RPPAEAPRPSPDPVAGGADATMTIVSTRRIAVTGMTCDHCANAVRAEIGKLPGVTGVDVDVAAGTVRVSGDPLPDDVPPRESAAEAALRELREETGVAAGAGDVLGTLDDYATRSGFLITPVVVWCGPVGTLVRQSSEVARIHVIPLADFDQPPQLLRIPESPAPVLRLALLGGYVYAPTAAVIHQFCQLALHGVVTRVAHFEQP